MESHNFVFYEDKMVLLESGIENECQKTGYDTGPLLSLHPESHRHHPVQTNDSIIEIKEQKNKQTKKSCGLTWKTFIESPSVEALQTDCCRAQKIDDSQFGLFLTV